MAQMGDAPGRSKSSAASWPELVEHLPMGVFRLDHDGRLLWANRALARMLDAQSFEELVKARPDGKMFLPSFGKDRLDALAAGGGEERGLETTWTFPSKVMNVRLSVRTVKDREGKIEFYEGTAEDIADKTVVDESLRARADFLEEVVSNASVGIFVIDEDNKYVLINPECGRIVGHWPDDWTGREAGLHVHPEDQGKAMAHFIQAISGEQNEFEVRIEASDGIYRHCRVNLSPMMLGQRAHVMGVVSDITNRKNSEQTLMEKRSQNLNIILVGAITQLALRMSPDDLEASMKDLEHWFRERFEKIFEEDMGLISSYEPPGEKDMEGPELVVRRYMRFYSSLLGIFGVRTEYTYGPSSSTFEILRCTWLPEAKLSPTPCRICRTILCESFPWTGLDGSAEQVATIVQGAQTCKFVFKPGRPRHHPAAE